MASPLPSLGCSPSLRCAQSWTVINLHPANAAYSSLASTTGSQPTGTAGIGGRNHASIWIFSAKRKPGRNVVHIYAQDSVGLRSPTRKFKITRHNPHPTDS